MSTPTDQHPYLVVPNTKLGAGREDLRAFLQAIEEDSEVALVHVTGSPEDPARLQIKAAAPAIQRLRERFGERLFIEPDRPLNLFQSTPPGYGAPPPVQQTRGEKIMADRGTSGNERIVEKGKRQLLIAPRRGRNAQSLGLQPLSTASFKGLVTSIPGVEVVRVLKPRKVVQSMAVGPDEANETYVAQVDHDRAELLKQTAPPHLIVEEDAYLDYGSVVQPLRASTTLGAPPTLGKFPSQPTRIRVLGDDDKPVPNVHVTLTGDAFPCEGETDGNGEVELQLVMLPGSRPRSLFANPPRDYWDRYLVNPNILPGEVNVVRLTSLSSSIPGFPEQFRYGWGQRLMGLDLLPPQATGKGVRIGIIDSGADRAHPLLQHIRAGLDLTNPSDPKTWSTDVVGHGSHCAGIITARGQDGLGIKGFAPEAEIHVFKIFPGGQYSSLLEALDECMARDLDVVNLSLGSPYPSQAVEQKLEECVLDGVACIVAAGNSGGPVQYPASSPNVLAVAAIGKLNEFPPECWDEQTVIPGLLSPDGLFSPSFTCFGPQIAVCAPGVGIVSTVPDGAYEPQSGTSMAAPHVTGLAALVLAHHPAFQTTLRQRGPQRVSALFGMIRAMCSPVQLGPERTGFGFPRLHPLLAALETAVGPSAQAWASAAQMPAPSAQVAPMGVLGALGAGPYLGQPSLGSLLPLQMAGGALSPQSVLGAQLGSLLAGRYVSPPFQGTSPYFGAANGSRPGAVAGNAWFWGRP